MRLFSELYRRIILHFKNSCKFYMYFCDFCCTSVTLSVNSTHHSAESKLWNAADLASAKPIMATAETEMTARRAREVFMVGDPSRN